MTHTTVYRRSYPKRAAPPSALALRRHQVSLVEMSDKLAELGVLLEAAKAEGKKTIPNPFHRKRT